MSFVGSNALKHFVEKYFGDYKKIQDISDGTVTDAIASMNNSLGDTNEAIKKISRAGNNWINTDTDEPHAFSIGIDYGAGNQQPIPLIKFDSASSFPLLRILGNENGIKLHAIQLYRGSDAWYLRLHARIDGGNHVLQVRMEQVS